MVGGQVIAPLLLVQRVANHRALTSNTIASGGRIDSFHVRSRRESTGGSRVIPSGSASNGGRDTVQLVIAVEARDNSQDSRV